MCIYSVINWLSPPFLLRSLALYICTNSSKTRNLWIESAEPVYMVWKRHSISLHTTRWTFTWSEWIQHQRAKHCAAVEKKKSFTHGQTEAELLFWSYPCTPEGAAPTPHLYLSLLAHNRPDTLFFYWWWSRHLSPLTSRTNLDLWFHLWDICIDTGIRLMTPVQVKGHCWKVKSRCPTASVTSGSDFVHWLSKWTVNGVAEK